MIEAEYRKLDAVSYSFLKDLSTVGPKVIVETKDKKQTSGLTLGNLVDSMMTNPKYDWRDDYVISKYSLDLSGEDAVSRLVCYLNDNPAAGRDEDNILTIAEGLGLLANIKDRNKKLARLMNDKYKSLLETLDLLNNGKFIILEEDFNMAMQMVETLQTHEFTSDIFNPKGKMDVMYQTAIVFKINGILCKSLLDIILIDHENKKIYPKDLKSGAEESFLKNFSRYKYYLQAAMYTIALKDFVQQNNLQEYEIMPFEFIYINRYNPYLPQLYTMSRDYIDDYIVGFKNKYGEWEKGIFSLIEDYKWYIKNNVYDMMRSLKENHGKTILINTSKQ